jgi:hypothetical protein
VSSFGHILDIFGSQELTFCCVDAAMRALPGTQRLPINSLNAGKSATAIQNLVPNIATSWLFAFSHRELHFLLQANIEHSHCHHFA